MNGSNSTDTGFIDIPIREMIQQLRKGVDIQLFFQQVRPQGTYTFEVFDGTVE